MGNIIDGFYKGFIETSGKTPKKSFTNDDNLVKSVEEAEKLESYAGVLAEDAILVDVDDETASEKLMNLIEGENIYCRVIQTTRGRHFLFKNDGSVAKCNSHLILGIGLEADIKIGRKNSIEVLKVNGETRFCEYDCEDNYDTIPFFLKPIKVNKEEKEIIQGFKDLKDGDGRNTKIYNYIVTLYSKNCYTKEETIKTIELINKYIFNDSVDEKELKTLLRNDSFEKLTQALEEESSKGFNPNEFAREMLENYNIVKIDGQLYIYKNGFYQQASNIIESVILDVNENLQRRHRSEIISYLQVKAETKTRSDARYICFKNGIYDLLEEKLIDFTSEIILTNQINCNFNPSAYNELTDSTLNKLACNDQSIRSLLEECIGYCFYRRNELGKAFILTGKKSNGKSTFLLLLNELLGNDNVSNLDLSELGDRFNKATLFSKLANIGDDISSNFLPSNQLAIFKKIVTGSRIPAENKGESMFFFEPFVKLLFSANEIPRMKDPTGAIQRRLVIIPFNATFSKTDADFDPYIKYKLIEESSIEYLAILGVEAIKRVLQNNDFTQSDAVDREMEQFNKDNNPLLLFIEDVGGIENVYNQPCDETFKRYQLYCSDSNISQMSKINFGRQLCVNYNVISKTSYINGKNIRIYAKNE